jgi:hypothetical protein
VPGRAKGLASRPRRAVTAAHLERYLNTTAAALSKVRVAAPERSHHRRLADDFLQMAKAYYDDALHFRGAGDFVNALSCVNYAHGWLDAGARLGLFDVGGDDRLFTLAD